MNLSKEPLNIKKNFKLNKHIAYKSTFLCLAFFLGVFHFGFTQSKTKKDSLWSNKGKVAVLINQASFGNWLGGGTNNINGILSLDYTFRFKNDNLDWTTNVDTALGYTKTQASAFSKKTDDRIEINSVLVRVGKKSWGFSTSFNLKSQWIEGYKYSDDPDGVENRMLTTDFLSPLYLRFGLGFAYKKDKIINLQIEPITGRLIYVASKFTRDLPSDETYFGVSPGRQTRWELNCSLAAQTEWTLFTNVVLKNRLVLISNYLEDFTNVDLDYIVKLDMKINNFMSAALETQLVYDDNALSRLQSRQIFGVSVGFSF